MVTIEWTQRRHADGIMRRHRFSFGIPEVESSEKEQAIVLRLTSDPIAPLSGQGRLSRNGSVRAGASVRSLMPSLTLRQEFIKARQLMSESNSANHLPEL